MRLQYITLFFSFLTLSTAFSQNWQLLDQNKTYFFKHSDSLYITNTIKIDSTVNSASDTSFYIHERLKICDTCTNIPPQAVGGVVYHGFAPEIFGYAPFYSVSGNHFNLDENIIEQDAQVSDTWTFNFTTGVMAEIVQVDEISVFGNMDSIKVIALSSLDTIVISKNHGIIRYPDFENPGTWFDLVGYHEGNQSYGEFLPNLWTIYDFEVDDVYCFHLDRLILWDGEDIKVKIRILEDLSTSNKVSYRVKILRKNVNTYNMNDPQYWTQTSFTSNYSDTFELAYENDIIENRYSGILPLESDPWGSSEKTFYQDYFVDNYDQNRQDLIVDYDYKFIHHQFDAQLGYIKTDAWFKYLGDSLFYEMDPSQTSEIMDISFSDQFGRHFQEWQGFEILTTDELVGYIIDGDTTGTIYEFPEDLGFDLHHDQNLKIYPNPAKDIIYVPEFIQVIQIYSQDGQLVKEVEPFDNSVLIDNLSPGFYLVRGIDGNDRIWHVKLMIE